MKARTKSIQRQIEELQNSVHFHSKSKYGSERVALEDKLEIDKLLKIHQTMEKLYNQ